MQIQGIEVAPIVDGYLVTSPEGEVYHHQNSWEALRCVVNLLDDENFTVVSQKDEFDKLSTTATEALTLIAQIDVTLNGTASDAERLIAVEKALTLIQEWQDPRRHVK